METEKQRKPIDPEKQRKKKQAYRKQVLKRLIILEALVLIVTVSYIAVRVYFESTLEKIDLNNYPVGGMDHKELSAEEWETANAILTAIEAKETYIPSSLSNKSHQKLWCYFYWRYDEAAFRWYTDYEWLFTNTPQFEEAERKMDILDAEIEKALSDMYEGSDRFKLYQISKYLSKRITYKLEQPRALPAWESGEGNCQTYAKIFYRMATRLGIQTYICTNGEHCWNMVELDGENYFYDVCYYDGDKCGPNIIFFLHNKNAWGRTFNISVDPPLKEEDTPVVAKG